MAEVNTKTCKALGNGIVVTCYGDYDSSEHRTYSCRAVMAEGYISWSKTSGNLFSNNTSEVAPLLIDVPGVKEVNISAYEVHIKKADSFSWDEIEPEVVRILLKHGAGGGK